MVGDMLGEGASIAMDEARILRPRCGQVLDLWDVPEDVQAHADLAVDAQGAGLGVTLGDLSPRGARSSG
jgi:hypothetical protein